MAEGNGRVYRTELEGLRAPLGVILYLIKRDNLNIYDIPIARITEAYLGYLDFMEELHIELAGEFFVMAATLMRIKIQMLLRKDETEEDPRAELVRSLLEYKKMVEAAKSFKELEEERLKVFKRIVPDREKELVQEPVLELNLYQLLKAFRKIISEFEEIEVSEIEPEIFTIEEKFRAIVSSLADKGQLSMHELFRESSSRLEMIVTFIALLELIKLSRVKARQEGAFGSIWIYPGPGLDEEVKTPILDDESGDVPPEGLSGEEA